MTQFNNNQYSGQGDKEAHVADLMRRVNALEAPFSATTVVQLCFIDESIPSYTRLDLGAEENWDGDLADLQTTLAELETAPIGCGEVLDTTQDNLKPSTRSYPSEVTMFLPFGRTGLVQSDFESMFTTVKGSVTGIDKIILHVDNSGSMTTSTLGSGFTSFKDTWLPGEHPEATITLNEFGGERWLKEINDGLIGAAPLLAPTSWNAHFLDLTSTSLGTSPEDTAFADVGGTIHWKNIEELRDAVEALAPFFTNSSTGNTFNMTDGDPDNLYFVAMEPTKANYGASATRYTWQRTIAELYRQPQRDIDVGELHEMITVLENS